mmetsp:Transcript_21371/g.9866  ORF Transcript_21371/g.9866 Transcript_21371/m.9866 type:complete len:97 (-) Transcript_21371:695-985(-)
MVLHGDVLPAVPAVLLLVGVLLPTRLRTVLPAQLRTTAGKAAQGGLGVQGSPALRRNQDARCGRLAVARCGGSRVLAEPVALPVGCCQQDSRQCTH